jgi:hypothetical protein
MIFVSEQSEIPGGAMKASLSKRALASVLGGAALVGVAVTGVAVGGASTAASAAVTPHTVGYSNRVCFFGVQNLFTRTIGAPVSAGQPVVVSAAELNSTGDEFVGLASVPVENVVVTNGAITTVVDANWGSPINVCLHYIA